MEIKRIDASNIEKYDLLAAAKGSVFNSPAWQKMYADQIECYGILNNDNKLIGGFHLYKTKLGGLITQYKNPPFTPHIGIFSDNQSGNKSNSLSFEKSISVCLADFFDKLPFQIFTIAFPDSFNDMQAFIWKKFKTVPNYTYQINLELSEEALLKNLASDKRNSINKAAKDGVSVEICTNLKIVKQLVENTYSRKAQVVNQKLVDAILFNFSTKENSFAYVSTMDSKPTAMSYCIHDKNTAYYILGGYDNSNKHQGAGVLALWNCILHAKRIGLKKFDFEGSMIPQVEKYFRGFGGDLIPYFTLNKANIVLETALKFVKREAF